MNAPAKIDLTKLSAEQMLRLLDSANKELAERHLYEFLRQAWKHMDPAPFVDGWHLEAMCEHLEAVSSGDIRRLLINVPPRHCKSLLVSVAWPAWTWIQRQEDGYPLSGPQVKFLCLSYASTLALDHALMMRRLIGSEWYQRFWGDRVKLTSDQEAKEKFDNTAGGTRMSGGLEGTVTGRGGDIQILDDPHKVKEVESEVTRLSVLNTYDRTLRNRVTNPNISAKVVVMQRVHDDDLSGHILSSDEDYVHVMLPEEYDSSRQCITSIGWQDPRAFDDDGEPLPPSEADGQLLWPEQWSEDALKPFKADPYVWAGQYQQSPVPDGGGIIKRDWWQLYEGPKDATGKETYPVCEFVLASLDTAMGEKEENDYTALSIWGVWRKNGLPKLLLLHFWKRRLPLHGRSDKPKDKTNWGVVELVADSCTRFSADRLIIENKTRGKDVADEIRRLYREASFGVELWEPRGGDKVARTHAIVPMFTDEMIYAPDRTWADELITEMSVFPKGTHDDGHDTAVQAFAWFRKNGLVQLRAERDLDDGELKKFKPKSGPLYPGVAR